MGKLDKTQDLENRSLSFIFEPKDLVPFENAWEWQKKWQNSLMENKSHPSAVWMLQHSSCYTLGRGGSEKNLLFSHATSAFDLYRIDRGGEVTHHLPGQLVVYLVVDLHRYQMDLNWYLRKLENLIQDVLGHFGLASHSINGLTGIWVENVKVASIGIGCRRWITQHGFALNVDCDLSGFDEIVPCGLKNQEIGNLQPWLPGLKVDDVQVVMKEFVKHHFDFVWVE